MCFHYTNLDEKKDWIFSMASTANVPTRLKVYKRTLLLWWVQLAVGSGMDGKSHVLASSSSKSWCRKPFGFCKCIAWFFSPIPSGCNNHKIASKKLNLCGGTGFPPHPSLGCFMRLTPRLPCKADFPTPAWQGWLQGHFVELVLSLFSFAV